MNHNLANFLRDFAAANNADFEPEQIQNLVESANLIENLLADCEKWKQMSMELNDEAKNLRNERDDARWEVCCNLSSNGSIDDATREMKDRGWDTHEESWGNVTTTQYWCDDCGDAIEKGNEFFYAELPCDIASANKGESATVCRKCDKRIEADCCNAEHRTSH